MTAMTFEDAAPVELDSVPPMDDVEYPCEVCGRESGPYSGRGRRPTKCREHKRQTRSTSGASRRTTNDALAAQASAVLEQLNGVFAIGLMVVGFNMTASALAANNDAFKENAFEALKTDPDLCKLICKGGVKSGKVALGIAYASLGTQVVPVAVQEFKAKREERRVRMEAMEAENA
jgi:hypothetical protein